MIIPLSKNFKKSEFDSRDGVEVPSEYMHNLRELVLNLQIIRDHIDKPVKIISGFRTKRHNRKIGGARKSQHLTACAADFRVDGLSVLELYEIIIDLMKEGQIKAGGVGLYPTFVHYDIRGWNARWSAKGKKDDLF
jgi:uncharacterized protein YcbK (DUF882 family)